jgi:translation initiation factor IF-2
VIYEIIEDMKDLMVGKLKPVFKEEILGHAEVRAVFKISRTGVVAGCAVTDGQMRRGEGIRVFREDELLYEGKLNSLRHVKDDVSQVEGGRECGISLDDWNGFAEGDIIECYTMRQLQRTLAD